MVRKIAKSAVGSGSVFLQFPLDDDKYSAVRRAVVPVVALLVTPAPAFALDAPQDAFTWLELGVKFWPVLLGVLGLPLVWLEIKKKKLELIKLEAEVGASSVVGGGAYDRGSDANGHRTIFLITVGGMLGVISVVAIMGNMPKSEAPKSEAPKSEAPKPEAPKPEAPKPETPKPETPKPETPKPETPKPETPKPETPKPETPTDSGKFVKHQRVIAIVSMVRPHVEAGELGVYMDSREMGAKVDCIVKWDNAVNDGQNIPQVFLNYAKAERPYLSQVDCDSIVGISK